MTYYDEEGRAIQVSAQNHKGSVDRSSMKLDFAGRVQETKLSTLNSLTVLSRTAYDRGGRTKSVCQQVFDASTPQNGKYWEPVGRYGYNGIGELDSKILGCGIQKVDYAHNMRGWMTKMNNPSQLDLGQEKDFFGMSLGYDAVGNITNWNYRSAQKTGAYSDEFSITPKDPFAYGFTYDNLYRIKTASLSKSGTEVFALSGNESGMGYDANGNITSLKRTFNGSVVDNLTYSYAANTNKLSGVSDAGTNPSTPNEFFANNATYGYDLNGNLISDSGKGISNIAYNYFNLTQTVTKGSQTVVYTYDAGGQKLKADFGTSKVYDYMAGLVYVNDSLEFVPTAEGRVLPPGRAINPVDAVSNAFYRYEYQLKDHLGNLRVACRCAEKPSAASPSDAFAPIVVQENNYDPWGLGLPLNQQSEKVSGSPTDRFTYNGIEKQPVIDIYLAKFRGLDSQIGRWWSVDPKPDQSMSLYAGMSNNPIRYSDPLGDTIIVDKMGVMLRQFGKDKLIFQQGKKGNLTQIGELGKSVNLSKILPNIMSSNKEAAKRMGAIDFAKAVRPGGKWDYKNTDAQKGNIFGMTARYEEISKEVTSFTYGRLNFSEGGSDVGNYNFGFTGRYVGETGYSPLTLWSAGGILQTSKDIIKGNFGKAFKEFNSMYPIPYAPFGDEPDDFIWTTTGMIQADYEKKNNN